MHERHERIRHDLLAKLKVGDQLVISTYKVGTGAPARNSIITIQAIQDEWVQCQYGLWHRLADSNSSLLVSRWNKASATL